MNRESWAGCGVTEMWLGCGVTGHDESCLCDVVIKEPLPPINESIKDGVRDLWMGKELCDLKGYGVPWTRESILDYLVDLETFYDAYHYSKHSLSGESLYEMEPLEFKDDDSPFVRWGQVREVVQYAMDKFNDSLVDIMNYYELSPELLMDSLTTGKSGIVWDETLVGKLDELFMADNLNYRDIARQLNLTVAMVNGIKKYWTVRRERLKGGDKPAQNLLHKLAKETDMSPRDIVERVQIEFGKEYKPTVVNKIRSRHRARCANQ